MLLFSSCAPSKTISESTDGEIYIGLLNGTHPWNAEVEQNLKKRWNTTHVAMILEAGRVNRDRGLAIQLFDFLNLFLEPVELEEWKERVRAGGEGAPGYGHLKVRLAEAFDEHFGPARARYKELMADPAELDRVLLKGAEKARARAVVVRDRALAACGLR